MENRQDVLEFNKQLRQLVERGTSVEYIFRMTCEILDEIRSEVFKGAKFFQLRWILDLERIRAKGLRVSYALVLTNAVDWIRDNSELFPFTLPSFHPGNSHELAKEMRQFGNIRPYWETNIPAFAELIELQCEVEFASDTGQPVSGNEKNRRCYDRDHTFLQWYEAEETETFHSPAKIRDKWNKENPADRISRGKQGIQTVKKGMDVAREEQEKMQKI